MRTDMSMDEMVKEITQPQPAPRAKRKSGIFFRLREKKAKAENWLKASEFEQQVLTYRITKKAAVLSVMKQHGVKTREARLIIKDSLPKKHRSRS